MSDEHSVESVIEAPAPKARKPRKPKTKAKPAKTKARKAKAKPAAAKPRGDSKNVQLIALVKRAKGASIAEIAEALTWQPHTTRAAISRLASKQGLKITTEQHDRRGRIYHAA